MRVSSVIYFVLLVFLAAFPTKIQAATTVDNQNYRRAFDAVESGRPGQIANFIDYGRDSVLNKVLTGYAMAMPGNSYSFAELVQFITENPDWPDVRGITMIAEQKIPSSASPDQVVNWFNAHPPITASGFYRYIDALDVLGQAGKAREMIRARWIERSFSGDELSAFHSRFGHQLTINDHYARLDRLLWENEVTSARQMYRFVDNGVEALAEARLALANQLNGAESYVSRVPSQWQNDPGLLFERLRWRRKNNLDASAMEILNNPPANLVRPDSWWDERNIILRRMIERRDYKTAQQLAANHGLTAGYDFVQAEFIAGWLALRSLNRADLAHEHFNNLLQSATTPVSRARGYYWLGRTYEALGNKKEAEQAYESAAALNCTFYGQLATAKLYANPVITSVPEPAIPASVRESFFARDMIQAISKLYYIGEVSRARTFFKAALDAADTRAEFVLILDLAYKLKRPDWAITAAKAANQKNMIMGAGAFPILSIHIPSPPDPAFTHSLMRQESMFNADVKSPAGARGLMQLLPSTAKGVAKKLGIPFSESRLSDPSYNVRLGTAFVQSQLDNFDGSYVLALAAYNAGPGRVKEWNELFGDPRTSKLDPIDWIELIPIYETRNYVQRIMENFQVYKARLSGGQAPLTILQDLRK